MHEDPRQACAFRTVHVDPDAKLHLPTVADVRATNPKLWNTWKSQLFQETYELTKRALQQGLETPIQSRVID